MRVPLYEDPRNMEVGLKDIARIVEVIGATFDVYWKRNFKLGMLNTNFLSMETNQKVLPKCTKRNGNLVHKEPEATLRRDTRSSGLVSSNPIIAF
ncbi:MAG: hypothetical protein CM15mP127_07900 [Gammaproteobacteria bacterium]|nr:MAG: hypothetical protein CM15mP127_07900 [Gammaproteobacteria bacterium]